MTHAVNGADFLASILADDPEVQGEFVVHTTMKFEIAKPVLLALLDKAITVVPTRDVMPVLKCFQFDVSAQRLRVVASDCDLSLIASTTKVAVTQPGVAVFPARRLLDIVKSADGDTVALKVIGPTAHIGIGRASWSLKLQGGDDYPAMPAITEAEFTSIERTVFLAAITAVRYAASRDPSKANLNIIDVQDGKLTTTDGARVQQIKLPNFPLTLRIPISAVDDLLRLLKMTDLDTIHVGQSDDKLIFRFGSDVFIVSKMHAAFPDMEAAMLRPAMENKHALDSDRAALLGAIRRVRINADQDSSAIALSLTPGLLSVQAKDKYGNTATESVEVTYTGPARTLVVNHGHLTDLVNTHAGSVCTFRLGDDTKTRRSPLMLRNPDTGTVGVVQQMNLDWTGL